MKRLAREDDGLWVLSDDNKIICRFFIGQTVEIELSTGDEGYCPIGEVKSIEWTNVGLGINIKDDYINHPTFIKIQDIEKMELFRCW